MYMRETNSDYEMRIKNNKYVKKYNEIKIYLVFYPNLKAGFLEQLALPPKLNIT